MEIVTPHQALAKAYKYCAYQERCQQEVRNKLYGFQLAEEEVENILVKLIEENFLNEERFAITYASGKFNANKWGKTKIKISLKQKGVSDYCIKKALLQINNIEYIELIEKLIKIKSKTLSEENKFIKAKKLHNYLLSKGFENEIVISKVKEILKL